MEHDYRQYLEERHRRSLDERIKRRMEIESISFGGALPDLLWRYSTESFQMYVDGYFIGCVLLCASAAELILADQLTRKLELTDRELRSFGIGQMITLNARFGILDSAETERLHELRKLRNDLSHADAGKLNDRAKQHFSGWVPCDANVGATMFLGTSSVEGLDRSALRHLQGTRQLMERLYAERE